MNGQVEFRQTAEAGTESRRVSPPLRKRGRVALSYSPTIPYVESTSVAGISSVAGASPLPVFTSDELRALRASTVGTNEFHDPSSVLSIRGLSLYV